MATLRRERAADGEGKGMTGAVTRLVVVESGAPVVVSGLPTGERTEGLGPAEIPAVVDRVAAALDFLRSQQIAHGPVDVDDVRVRRNELRVITCVELMAPETGPTPAPGMRFPLPQPDGGARQHNTPPEQPGTVSPPTVSAGPFPPAPPGQPFGTAPPPTPPKKRRRLLLGALAAAVVVVLVVGVGIWALLRDSSSSSSTTKLDAATGNSIWDQQIGSMVMCQADNPSLQSPAQTVKLDDFYAEALQLCFAQMWIPPMMGAGKALPPEGYTMHVAVSTSDVDASGPTSGCTQAFAAAQQYLNCPNGFWLRDPGGRYSSVPLAYAVDLSASMVAYQALITAGVVGEVATSMKDAGPTSEQAAAHSRTLNAASACLGGVMIKAAQGHGLSESDVAMIRNLATFGSVSTDGKPAFDISPGNFRYWRNYGIDNGTIESCKSPFDHQEQVK
ncbi:hypothetical protein [Gordonia bronchialis]|uniref:hypothetical protein n=1 Tax=Gordonia bronchialis TaxID=2054 RepID=UPI00226D775C|nr:hypothetical protein [Gordonia bronchialis]